MDVESFQRLKAFMKINFIIEIDGGKNNILSMRYAEILSKPITNDKSIMNFAQKERFDQN